MAKRVRLSNSICMDCGKQTAKNNAVRCGVCHRIFNKRTIPQHEYSRNWQLKKKYNLEPIEFEVLWEAFMGKCGICDVKMVMPIRGNGQPRNACVIDHNHETGNIRGLLCNSCNKALGLFNDSVLLLRSALTWIEYSHEKTRINS